MTKEQIIFGGLGFSAVVLSSYYMDIHMQDQAFWYVLVPLTIAVGVLTRKLGTN